jgi:hypothetical protein
MSLSYNNSILAQTISVSGVNTNVSGVLQVNGVSVSVSGHTHNSLTSLVAGSVSSPSIASSGDLSTGIYFPASGSISISSSGYDRFKIDSNGNSAFGGQNINSLRYVDISNGNNSSSAGSILRLITSNTSGTGNTSVDLVKYKNGQFGINNNETSPAAFTSFNVGTSERLRITSSGNIGIGTTVPTSKLHVVGDMSATSGNFTQSLQVNNIDVSLIRSYTAVSGFPASGLANNYYLASDSSKIYQWTGSQYVEIGPAFDTISANNITLGTLPDARISSNIATYAQMGLRDNQPAGAIDIFPRGEGSAGAIATFSGSFYLHCFTPAQSLTVSQISVGSGNTAAAGATLVQFGLYSYNETTATLLARINSDTSIFSSINTLYTRSFSTTGGYPSSFTLQAGTRYGIGVLIIATTMPTLSGKAVSAVMLGLNPRLCVQVGSQSSLPTSVAITAIAGAVFFGRLS